MEHKVQIDGKRNGIPKHTVRSKTLLFISQWNKEITWKNFLEAS